MHNTVKAAYINKKNDFINVLEGILWWIGLTLLYFFLWY
jgi:hypothetical protein